jgi:beta-glucanase (GH16 family)
MKSLLTWLLCLMLGLQVPAALAQSASDYTQGVAVTGSTATVWFKPTSATSTWVDVHYKNNAGAQQNLRMTLNAATARLEQKVLAPVALGDTISYNFTYNKGAPAYDTPWFSHNVGTSNSPTTPVVSPTPAPTPTPATTGFSFAQGSDLAGTTTTLWYKPSQTISWIDVHYVVTGQGQQNFRMAFNTASARYEKPLTLATGQTINYWFTYSITGTSAVDTPAYNQTPFVNPTGMVAAPSLIPPPGSYTSAQTVSLSSPTSGATIRFTTDGTTPTASSPAYSGTFLISKTTTVKAIATKAGFSNSPMAGGAYNISNGAAWNGMTTFNIVNATGGKWADSQVYWAIIGRDWATGQFVHVDLSGRLLPMQLADNGALQKNGMPYSNYFSTLAQGKTVTIPAIDSARILLSVGSPMYIKVVTDGAGKVGYAGANIENPTDANLDVIFDFGEMAILPKGHPAQGIFVNTTRVDHFGFPIQLRVQGLNGYDQTVGEPLTESRDTIFSKFIAEVPTEFKGLAQAPYAPYRIMAPAHASFQAGKSNANYLQPSIDAIWAKYRTQNLTFTLPNLGTFTGRVSGDVFRFTGGVRNGVYTINGKPTTSMVLLGNGLLNDTVGGSDIGTQLQIQAQVCAALNRGVFEDPANWHNAAAFYPTGANTNQYAKFWHEHNINKLSYGFAYDDVGNHSPSLHTDSPTTVTFTIGWGGATGASVPDTAPPKLTISDNVSGSTASGPVTFTFSFNKDVGTSFSASDIVVTGGTKGVFTRISGTQATLVVTPATSGTIAVSVAAGQFSDGANNLNTAANAVTRQYVASTSPTSTTWTLAWSDEFNGTALNPAVWSHDTGAGGWGNGESQFYQPQNAVVKDGFLSITAKREAVGGAPYTSARIQTSRKKTFSYGRIEMRAKLPGTQGMWPAFWLLGETCSSFGLYGGNVSWPACGEIDAMEMVGGLADGSGDFTTHGTLHYLNAANVNPMPGVSYRSPTRLSADFHTYTVDWTPQGFTWYIDGVAFGSKAMASDMTTFNKPFFLLLNLAVGGNWGGWPNATTVFPQTYVIDYVRHYARAR